MQKIFSPQYGQAQMAISNAQKPQASQNGGILPGGMNIMERFRFFYRDYHKGVCAPCYAASEARLAEREPAWFGHTACADAYRKLSRIFAQDMIGKGVPLHTC